MPPWRVEVTSLLVIGENVVEVEYQPSLRNSLIGQGIAGNPLLRHFKNRREALVPSGLLGPIRLIKVAALR
jgi:hypothetical protein